MPPLKINHYLVYQEENIIFIKIILFSRKIRCIINVNIWKEADETYEKS